MSSDSDVLCYHALFNYLIRCSFKLLEYPGFCFLKVSARVEAEKRCREELQKRLKAPGASKERRLEAVEASDAFRISGALLGPFLAATGRKPS